jgi:hypothetical protein
VSAIEQAYNKVVPSVAVDIRERVSLGDAGVV